MHETVKVTCSIWKRVVLILQHEALKVNKKDLKKSRNDSAAQSRESYLKDREKCNARNCESYMKDPEELC